MRTARTAQTLVREPVGPRLLLGGAFERLGEFLERGTEVGDRLPNHPEHRTAVLLAHVESGLPVSCRREGVRALALEETQGHATRPDDALGRLELRDLDRERAPRVDL